jgi:hypothetical protein
VSEVRDLRELRAGATGQPAYRDSGEELAESRLERRQVTLEDSTLLARDAAAVYREVLGPRIERHEPEPGHGSTFL